jgi:hypothetical protein
LLPAEHAASRANSSDGPGRTGGGVPGRGAGQEAGGGVFSLVGEDLGVSQPGVIIEGGVQVAVAQDGLAVAGAPGRGDGGLEVVLAGLPAVDAPSAAVGDVAELLDVDVDQLAGPLALVAADGQPGTAVQVRQARAAVAAQDRVDGRRRQVQPGPDPGRARAPGEPQADDPPLGLLRRPCRAAPRPGGAVRHGRRPAVKSCGVVFRG